MGRATSCASSSDALASVFPAVLIASIVVYVWRVPVAYSKAAAMKTASRGAPETAATAVRAAIATVMFSTAVSVAGFRVRVIRTIGWPMTMRLLEGVFDMDAEAEALADARGVIMVPVDVGEAELLPLLVPLRRFDALAGALCEAEGLSVATSGVAVNVRTLDAESCGEDV